MGLAGVEPWIGAAAWVPRIREGGQRCRRPGAELSGTRRALDVRCRGCTPPRSRGDERSLSFTNRSLASVRHPIQELDKRMSRQNTLLFPIETKKNHRISHSPGNSLLLPPLVLAALFLSRPPRIRLRHRTLRHRTPRAPTPLLVAPAPAPAPAPFLRVSIPPPPGAPRTPLPGPSNQAEKFTLDTAS